MQHIALIGASGGIGTAIAQQLETRYPEATLHSFSRSNPAHPIDLTDEHSINIAASHIETETLDLLFIASGILHNETSGLTPEKSLRDLTAESFAQNFAINTIGPALVFKHFLPKLRRDVPTYAAALCARVGSISDNRLGGWYSYRASKAALNMVIKTAAIELVRTHPHATLVGLHPGTVDTTLSQPFQKHVPDGKLFTPEYSAAQLVETLLTSTPEQNGKCVAYDGKEILP